jgi:hypothetical protein
MRYSFDGVFFGLAPDNNSHIVTMLARRPAKMKADEWYKFAGELAENLNRLHPNPQTHNAFDMKTPQSRRLLIHAIHGCQRCASA